MVEGINRMDMEELHRDVSMFKENPEKCNIVRTMTAEWDGGTRARIAGRNKVLHIGGPEDFGAMSVALASFLACELDVIVTHATLRGIELEKLAIEGTGRFNLARYMGVAGEPRPGYESVDYTVRIKAKNATPEEVRDLVGLCETASPVGDTLMRPVKVALHTVIE
jgi:uncharacterized OsmC-like protein